MTREHSSDNQGETSAARQVMEALAEAAKEMSDKFEETAQLAERLNTALDAKVNELFAEISQQTDFQVTKQLASLQEDKDRTITELLKLRHEELHTVLSIAEKLNVAIVDKVDEIFADFKKEAKQHLDSYKTSLDKKETDISQSATMLRMALKEKLSEQLEPLHETFSEARLELKATLSRQAKLIHGEADVAAGRLSKQRETLLENLEKTGSDKVNAVEQRTNLIITRQKESFEKQLNEYAKLHDSAGETLSSKFKIEQDLQARFAEMCSEASKMQLNVHENHFSNLSLQFKGEISSVQHDLESNIELAQTHLQTLLKQSVSLYNERANTLLAGFEKNVRSVRVLPSATDAENEASIEMLIERLKKELKRSATDALNDGKAFVEQDFIKFRAKLSNETQSALEMFDTHISDALNNAKQVSREQKNVLDDLRRRMKALEQLMDNPAQLDSLFNLLDED